MSVESDRVIGVFIAVLIILIAVQFDTLSGCESCKMYSMIWNKSQIENGINGYYNQQDFYCVWTKDRLIEEITITDNHERCHVLIHDNYEHFCLNQSQR